MNPLPRKPEPNLRDYQRAALRERDELVRTFAYLAHNDREAGRVASAEFYEKQHAAASARLARTIEALT